jgi:guanylate kinase
VDVKGGLHLKQIFGDRALAIFIAPPSVEELRRRLTIRATDTPEKIEERIAKAAFELEDAPQFDTVIVNDKLEHAQRALTEKVDMFLGKEEEDIKVQPQR